MSTTGTLPQPQRAPNGAHASPMGTFQTLCPVHPLAAPTGCFHPLQFGAKTPAQCSEPSSPSSSHQAPPQQLKQLPFPISEVTAGGGVQPPGGGGGILAERTRRCCRFRSCVPRTPRITGAGGFLCEQLVIKAPSTARGFRGGGEKGEAGGER